ncbi:MAG: AsmA family protein [Candidatus Mariimomonas ferrooxydans]
MAKKILLICIVLIAVIIIALTALIKIYVTAERVRAFIIPRAEKALNRKVNIGEINIGLFKGIEVKDLVIKEADEKNNFLSSKHFVLKYRLLPLLSKKVIIDEVKLISPEIRIERDRKGKFNFEDIGQKQGPSEEKEKKQADAQNGLPVSLLVKKIEIIDARLSFVDLKKELPYIKGSVNISTEIKSSGRNKIFTAGNMDLRLDEIIIHKTPAKHIRDLNVGLKYAVSMNLESDSIRIDTADLKVQEISASVTGAITNLGTSPKINIAVSIPETQVKNIQKSLKSFTDIKGLSLSGSLKADLKLTGPVKEIQSLKAAGTFMLGKVSINYNGVKAVLDGDLKFNEQSMTINLISTIGKNTAELKGSVHSYFKNQKINLNLYSKKLFLDEVFPKSRPKSSSPGQKGKPARAGVSAEAKPLDLRLTADGEIKIDSAIYKSLTMTDFYARYQLKNNKFEITKMTALVGKGRFNLNSGVDLSRPGYTYRLASNLDSLDAEEVVNSMFPKAKDTVFGTISFNLKLNGAGTLPENIRKNLVGSGDFNIKNGKIANNKISENLARFLGINELRTIPLKKADGTIKIQNGTARLDSIFSSDDISMNPSGNIGLDKTLDLAFDLKLSPGLTDKLAFRAGETKYIKDEAGWGVIPLKISGTFSAPSYSIDIARAGNRVIEKKTKKLIQDLLNKDKKQVPEGEKQGDKKPVDLLKELFK